MRVVCSYENWTRNGFHRNCNRRAIDRCPDNRRFSARLAKCIGPLFSPATEWRSRSPPPFSKIDIAIIVTVCRAWEYSGCPMQAMDIPWSRQRFANSSADSVDSSCFDPDRLKHGSEMKKPRRRVEHEQAIREQPKFCPQIALCSACTTAKVRRCRSC